MAEVKFALRAFLTEFAEPAATLERLNTFLFENSEVGAGPRLGLVSLVLAVINEKTGEAVCAAAAVEPPLIVRESGETEDVPAGGLPLGADANSVYDEALRGTAIRRSAGSEHRRPFRSAARPEFFRKGRHHSGGMQGPLTGICRKDRASDPGRRTHVRRRPFSGRCLPAGRAPSITSMPSGHNRKRDTFAASHG